MSAIKGLLSAMTKKYFIFTGLITLSLIILLSDLTTFNHASFLALNQLLYILPDEAWINITNLGTSVVCIALATPLLTRHSYLIKHLLITGTVSVLSIYLLKFGFGIPRPHLVLNHNEFHFISTQITSPAFPSGHSSNAFFVAGTYFVLTQNSLLRLLLLGFAATVALSRVAIGVHWPLDIIVGSFFGFWLGYFGCQLTLMVRSVNYAHYTVYEEKKLLLYLSLALCALITFFLTVRPLPYPNSHLPSYIISYVALIYSASQIIRRLIGLQKGESTNQ